MSDPSKPSENQGIFYSFPLDKNIEPDYGKVVEDKFLIVDGLPVKDPFFAAKGADTSKQRRLYKRLNADGTIDKNSEFDNSGNFLVVNKDFNLADDKAFAEKINKINGFWAKIRAMRKAFSDGGSEDLQRGASHGVPGGETNPAAKDSASWNFGYITQLVKIPNVVAKIGADKLNVTEFINHLWLHEIPSLHYGMDLADAENMNAGIDAAKKAIGFHKSLLPVGGGRFISVAPTRPARQSAKPKPAAFQRSEPESFHTSLRQMATSSAAIGISQEIKNFIKALTPARSGLSHEIAQAIAGARALSKDLISVSRAGASLSPLLAGRRSKLNNDPAAIQLAPFHLAASLGARRAATLPSFAPIANTGRNSGAVGLGRTGASVNPFTSAGSTTASATSDPTMQPQMDQWQFREMLSRELDGQARLPPSGATGFDPRLSPAWPGMKLPN